jgi:hypothetical protein
MTNACKKHSKHLSKTKLVDPKDCIFCSVEGEF